MFMLYLRFLESGVVLVLFGFSVNGNDDDI